LNCLSKLKVKFNWMKNTKDNVLHPRFEHLKKRKDFNHFFVWHIPNLQSMKALSWRETFFLGSLSEV
jgi:hypothetical protein